jgi:phosphoribosylformimino-5-aminoimidazole carboxamide ribotide isomerase
MKFRPCIDLHNGKVKQIVGSSLKDNSQEVVENFVSEKAAKYYAELFMLDKLSGGHVIMLGPGNEKQAISALQAYPGGLQIGGGITPENAMHYLEKGASHVIVTSYVFKDGEINFENLNKLKDEVGKGKLVLDLSCKQKEGKYFVVTDRWQKFTEFEVNQNNLDLLSNYCDEFLVHAVDVEGQCLGIQQDLVKKLGQWVSIPTTYAGGARSLEDINLMYALGNGKIDLTIGSALDIFGGNLPYGEVVKSFIRGFKKQKV